MSLRATATDLWQREEDRQKVDELLGFVTQAQVGKKVRLRVRDHGDVDLIEGGDRDGQQTNSLLGALFDAFHLDLPDGGWVSGAQWVTQDEPLLALREGIESFGHREVVHQANAYRGKMIIQTIRSSTKETVTGLGSPSNGPSDRFQASYTRSEDQIGTPVEATTRSALKLDAVGVLDPDKGFVTERVWSVTGKGVTFWRAGRLRLLGETEQLVLGKSGQVGPPRGKHPNVPDWRPVDRELH